MAKKSKLFRGINHKQVKENPFEELLADLWKSVNKDNPQLLASILQSQEDGYLVAPSKREYQIAATLFQWLGTGEGLDLLLGASSAVMELVESQYPPLPDPKDVVLKAFRGQFLNVLKSQLPKK